MEITVAIKYFMTKEEIIIDIQAQDNASSKISSIGQSITKLVSLSSSVTALGSSFLTLTNATDTVQKKQLAVEKTSLSLKMLYNDLAAATAKYGKDSERVAEIQEKIRIKEEQLAQQTSDLKQAQQQLSLTYISTTANMVNSVMALSTGFGSLIKGAGEVGGAFTGLKNSTMLLGSGMGQLNTLMQIVNKTAILTFVTSPWGIAIMGISSAIGILIFNVGGLRDALFNALKVVGEWLTNLPILGNLINAVTGFIFNFKDSIFAALQGILEWIKNLPILGDLIKGVTNLINGFKDSIFNALQGFYEWLKNLPIIGSQLQVLENAIKGLIDLFSKLLNLFNTKIDFKLPEFKWPWSNETQKLPETSKSSQNPSQPPDPEKLKKSVETVFNVLTKHIPLDTYFAPDAKFTLLPNNMVEVTFQKRNEQKTSQMPLQDLLYLIPDKQKQEVLKSLNENQEFLNTSNLKLIQDNTNAMKQLTQVLQEVGVQIPKEFLLNTGQLNINHITSLVGTRDPVSGRKILGAETYENRRTGETRVTLRTEGGNTINYVKNHSF